MISWSAWCLLCARTHLIYTLQAEIILWVEEVEKTLWVGGLMKRLNHQMAK